MRFATTIIVLNVLFAIHPTVVTGQKFRIGPIRVMSFNIRYGTANDGENEWDKRDTTVVDTIRNYGPDFVGLQEALEFQVTYLKGNFPGYGFHGVGRSDGINGGEYCGILYDRNRWVLMDSGHFWLSEEPDKPGSKSWDSSLPRMVSWIKVHDGLDIDTEMIFANTHFDHRGAEARKQSAHVIRKELFDKFDLPIIIAGDFNSTEADEPFQVLSGADLPEDEQLLDTYRVIHPEPSEFESTMTGWNGRQKGKRIDWILHSRHFSTINATIDRSQFDGRYPSDHYPVTAIVRMRK